MIELLFLLIYEELYKHYFDLFHKKNNELQLHDKLQININNSYIYRLQNGIN